ncbi:MAG: hypothetical protein KF817_03525 [Phycisphaeraceae bacterium]|nr:hypothetical protein [Phycisphaeraceae bacterium]
MAHPVLIYTTSLVRSALLVTVLLVSAGGCAATLLSPAAARELGSLGFHADSLAFSTRQMNVSWMTRDTIFMTRHQWDMMDVDAESQRTVAQHADRRLSIELMAAGEGAGGAFDWVLARVVPARGHRARPAPLDPLLLPRQGDVVAVQSIVTDMVHISDTLIAESATPTQVVGRITTVGTTPPVAQSDPGCRPPAGLLIHARLDEAGVGPGWSGSPAFVWEPRSAQWHFLGILVSAQFDQRAARQTELRTDRVTILRPPVWTFDLIPPDVPRVTMPSPPSPADG